ncbi:PKD-like family lipoprotein [Chitinophaga sp. 22536]|uniref:PKD-like family lipoprotein n=1 Tax=unclassified Chitinophaga TaxID=2619133 RepID=UPI003F87DD2C
MTTKYIWLLLSGCLISMAFTACYKDRGNYDYHDINQVDSIGGIAKNYTVLYGDSIRITPTVLATQESGDTARYTYRWEALIDGLSRMPGESPNVLVSSSRNLAIAVKLRPSGYDCFFRIKDKQTGVEWFKRFKLTVQSAVYQGWVALCDVNGVARLDMVARLGEEDRLITDLMSFVNGGLPVRHQPKQLVFAYRSTNINPFYLRTGDGLERIDGDNFTWKSTYGIRYEMLMPVGADFAPDYFFNSPALAGVDYVLAGNRVFHRNAMMGASAFGSPVNYVDEEKTAFRPAPFVASGYGGALLYDQDRQRFVFHDPMFGTKCNSLRDGTLFSYNTGRDMVYMAYTNYNRGDVYAILKDKAGKYYAYCINVSYSGVKQSYYTEMINAPELDKATAFAVSNQLGYVFYAAGGRVYEYDVFTNKAVLMADLGGERVSVLKCPLFSSYGKDFYTNLTNSLVVGSYDPARPDAGNGSIRVYSIPARNEPLQLTWSYGGLGKIVDLAYRER